MHDRSAAWAYLVVSSEQQVETLKFQRRWATESASKNNWRITEYFEGVSSGKDGTRQLLQRLVDRLRALKPTARPDRVLMIRLDRLGRGLGLEALAALAELVQLGVIIHTRQDGDYNIAKASDSILPLMRIVTGGIENEARRDKAKATYERRRKDGLVVGNKRPYGIVVVDGHDVAQEPQAMSVRLAFELSANGYGLSAIGARLRATAAPKVYQSGRAHVTEWTNCRVSKLLCNEAYRGVVVSESEWTRVQRLRIGRPRTITKSKNPWPLSGSLHCECGRMLIGSQRGSPARRVYRCSAAGLHGKTVTHVAENLESAFVRLLERLSASSLLVRKYALDASSSTKISLASATAKHAELESNLKSFGIERKRIWQLNKNGLLPDVHLSDRLTELDADSDRCHAEVEFVLAEIRAHAIDQEATRSVNQLISEASSLWINGDLQHKQIAARALARALHGLCVLIDGTLCVGPSSEWNRFYKRSIR